MDGHQQLIALCDGPTSWLIPMKLLRDLNKEIAVIIITFLFEGGSGFAEDDSEAELISASQQQERTRQKKFSKFFKELQGEVVNISKQIIYVKTSLNILFKEFHVHMWGISFFMATSMSPRIILPSTQMSLAMSPR